MARPLDPMIEARINRTESPDVRNAMRRIATRLEFVGAPMLTPQELADVARGHLRARRNFQRMRKNAQ